MVVSPYLSGRSTILIV